MQRLAAMTPLIKLAIFLAHPCATDLSVKY